jgi:hypothetical protein
VYVTAPFFDFPRKIGHFARVVVFTPEHGADLRANQLGLAVNSALYLGFSGVAKRRFGMVAALIGACSCSPVSTFSIVRPG